MITTTPPTPRGHAALRTAGWHRLPVRALQSLLTLGALFAVLLGALWWGQEYLIFRPVALPAEHRFQVPADVQEVWVEVNGARLNALHLRQPGARGVVFYLHGNGGNLDTWWVDPRFWRALGLDLFMIDYRGYGKSTGRVSSEAQLMADVRAAWAQLAPHYAGRKMIVLGRSLGSGLAAQLAATLPAAEQPALTVLISPYFSMLQLKNEHYAWAPDAVLRYPLRTDLAVAALRSPLLLIHGQRDTLIPPRHSEALAALAPGPQQALVLRLPDAGHGDVHRFAQYREGLQRALLSAIH